MYSNIFVFTAGASCLVSIHTLADFMLQTRWQAQNKSHNMIALAGHVFTYSIAMGIMGLFLILPFGFEKYFLNWVYWILFNFAAHFLTDFVTSRILSYNYGKMIAFQSEGDFGRSDFYQKLFWSWIGNDQMTHILSLVWSYYLFFYSSISH